VPDKANAFLLGRERIALNDLNPDYPALLVVSFILGDSSSARVPERLRQKDGLSYSVWTFLPPNAIDTNSTVVRTRFSRRESRSACRVFGRVRPRLEGWLHRRGVNAARRGAMQGRILGRTEDGASAER
jgi:zinc protease